MMDATVFSKDDLVDQYLKLATYGVPVVPYLCAVIGMNQVDIQALNYIQNEILQVSTAFLPLVSSNTQSGTLSGEDQTGGSSGGRPTQSNTDSESTVTNNNNATNEAK